MGRGSHGTGHAYGSSRGGHIFFRSSSHAGYRSCYPSYGEHGYRYPVYRYGAYIYTSVYTEPDYDVLEERAFDEVVDELVESLPSIDGFDDSIGAEEEPAADGAAAEDVARQRLLIEPDELPEDSRPQPESDSDETSDTQQDAGNPQRAA